MKRWIPSLLIAVLSLSPVATLASYAQASPDAPPQSSPGAPSQEKGTYKQERGMHKLDQLGLSPEQKEKVRALREGQKQKNEPLMAQFRDLRTQAKAARESGDQAKLESVRSQMQALKPKLQQARADYKKQLDAILTPEQRTKLDQMRAEYKGKRWGGEGSNY
jgi:Spy/CpxP family protein refolding chaperone